MANFVLGFLHTAENVGKSIAQLPIQASENYSNFFANIGNKLGGGQDQTIQQNMGGDQFLNKTLDFSGATGTNKQLLSDVAQVGTSALAPELSKVGGAIPAIGEGFAGKVATGAVKGAAEGAAGGAAFGTEQAAGNNQSLTMGFLQGAKTGAEFGGVLGGLAGGVQAHQPLNQVGGLNNATGSQFNPEELQKLAKSDNEKQIFNQVSDKLGSVVANDVSHTISQTDDWHTVQSVLNNSLMKHTPDITPVTPEATNPSPAPPTTPQSSLVGNEMIQQPSREGQPFINPPDANPEAPTKLSSMEAHQHAANVLNDGGTVDEAMNELMTKGGQGYGEAKDTINNLIRNGGAGILDMSKVNSKVNPLYGQVDLPKAQAGETERAPLNSKAIHNQVMRNANMALQEGNKLSDHDLGLLDQLRNAKPQDIINQADDKEQFSKVANLVKTYNDYNQAAGAHLGQDIPYKRQYGIRPQYDLSTDEANTAYQQAQAKLATQPGYTKGAILKNYEEAQQLGIPRLNNNALEDLSMDANQRANHLKQLALYKALDEAHPGQVAVGKPPVDESGTWRQLAIPGGQKLFMPQQLADEINKRQPAPIASGATKGYDTINSNLKNIKLAGGGFHSVNVVGSYIGQQLLDPNTYLHPVTALKDLGDVVKGTFSDKSYNSTLDEMTSRGKLLDADISGLKYGKGETAADVEPTAIGNKIPILKQIHASIFDRQIPLLKLKIFDQKTEGLDRNNPEDLKKMTDIAKQLNQNFGGFNREIQGLNPRQFQLAARGFLATDYNEGQIRTLVDAFKKGGPDGNLARQVVFGKALLFGGLATAGAAAGGEFEGQTPTQVATDILNKFINPSFKMGGYNVGFPTTQIAEVAKPIEQTVQGEKYGKPLEGLQNFASSRLAAVPSEVEQLGTNNNFYGQPLRGKNKGGVPITPGETASNIASGVLPIPASQTVRTATGNESPEAAIANTIGARVTPEFNPDSLPAANQTLLATAKKDGASPDQLQAMTSFLGILSKNSGARTAAKNKAIADLAAGDNAKAQQDITAYNKKLIAAVKPWAEKNRQYINQVLVDQLTGNTSGNDPYVAVGRGLLKLPSATTVRKDVQANPTLYGQQIGGP